MNPPTADAATELARVLVQEAHRLASDDLETVSNAMSRVRAASRHLAQALEARGWGGGVMYGFGEPGKWEDLVRNEQELDDLVGSGALHADWDAKASATGAHVPSGRRVSLQSRTDYVVTDEVALRRYVRRRVDQSSRGLAVDDELLTRNPVMVLSLLDGIEHHDYSGCGMELAGHQSLIRGIDRTLDELPPEEVDDAFPTRLP